MHRTRVFGFFIDAPLDAADAAVRFWSGVLGTSTRSEPGDPFTGLVGALPGDIALEVQAVDDAPRYHLDIETDDVPAERTRLVGLGAEVVADNGSWHVLRAPGGHLLCVVPVQSDHAVFAEQARSWP